MPHGIDPPPQGPERPLGRIVRERIITYREIEYVEDANYVLPPPEPPPKKIQTVPPKESDGLSPIAILREAVKAVPAVKWALGVGGLLAVITLVYSFQLDPLAAFIGLIVLFVFMSILVIFARVSALQSSALAAPAFVFTWFTLFMFMATTVVLFTSVFSNCPAPLRKWLTGENPAIPQWCPAQAFFPRVVGECPDVSGAWQRQNRTQTIILTSNKDCTIWGTLDTGAYFHEISGSWQKDHFDVSVLRTTVQSAPGDPNNFPGCKVTLHGRYMISDNGRQMTAITDRTTGGCGLTTASPDPGAIFTKK